MTDEWREFVEFVHEFHKEYILAADRKASFLLTGLLGFLGLSANALTRLDFELSLTSQLLFGISGFLGVISTIFAAWVVYPRRYDVSYTGFIYWDRILKHESRDDFTETVMNPPGDTEPGEEVAKNVFNIADIASRKYSWLRRSMVCVALMVFVSSVGLMFHLSSNLAMSVLAPTTASAFIIAFLLTEVTDD